MTVPWANHSDIASSGIFEAVHTGMTVSLIMTPRDQLTMCKADDQASCVVSGNSERYDYMPVLDSGPAGECISGIFHAAQFFDHSVPDGCIRDQLVPLAEEYLIGADASILDFITEADTKPCRLALAGARISGLVSISDLQKLPVRASLFALITGFEITMAEAIRRRYPADEDWLGLLNKGRPEKIQDETAKSKDSDSFVDRLLLTQFADKKTIIMEGVDVGLSKPALENEIKRMENLRNKVAHANDYASSFDEACKVCATVRDLLALREKIAEAGA